jgi:hypothetical protein
MGSALHEVNALRGEMRILADKNKREVQKKVVEL